MTDCKGKQGHTKISSRIKTQSHIRFHTLHVNTFTTFLLVAIRNHIRSFPTWESSGVLAGYKDTMFGSAVGKLKWTNAKCLHLPEVESQWNCFHLLNMQIPQNIYGQIGIMDIKNGEVHTSLMIAEWIEVKKKNGQLCGCTEAKRGNNFHRSISRWERKKITVSTHLNCLAHSFPT